MTTPNREYPEVPRNVTPDVPYQVNRVIAAIDLDVQGLDDSVQALDSKVDQIPPPTWGNVTGKPSTYPPSSHSHDRITGGGAEVDVGSDGSPYVRSEAIFNREYPFQTNMYVTSYGTIGRSTWRAAPENHNHSASDITSGTMSRSRIDGSTRAWSETSGSGSWATVSVDENGKFFKYTSSQRYKKDIEAAEGLESLLAIEPKTYKRIATGEQETGILAEELHDAGLTQFVMYDEEGQPDGVHYQLLSVALLAIARSQTARLDSFEDRLDKLEKRNA